jgi:hypothetical protein
MTLGKIVPDGTTRTKVPEADPVALVTVGDPAPVYVTFAYVAAAEALAFVIEGLPEPV